jgi:signal transduction histidine kinase
VQGFPAILGRVRGATVGLDMTLRRRDKAALAIVVLTFLLGAIAWSAGPSPTGVHLTLQGDQIAVGSVDRGSPADQNGIQPGMVVIRLDDVEPASLSQETKAAIVALPRVWGIVEAVSPGMLPDYLAAQKLASEQAAAASAAPVPSDGSAYDTTQPGSEVTFPPILTAWSDTVQDGYRANSGGPLLLGLAILLVGIWWLRRGRAGASLQGLAITLPAATAAPLLAVPIQLMPDLGVASLGVAAVTLAMIPLAADFIDRLEDRTAVARLQLIVVGLAVAAIVPWLAIRAGNDFSRYLLWSSVLAGCVAFVPGLLAARPTFGRVASDSAGSAPAPGRFVESTELVLAAATPSVALLVLVGKGQVTFAFPLVVWLAAGFLAGKFTLRPLLRLATRATFQRDVVVAATEAERARIAADIHDDALQDLTMLVRRLDAAGDLENAEAARTVAARLRAICGDLRLPILDDLGLGPALDWLTERFQSLAGGPVYLEVARDPERLPPNVELALFRVAQEALANAVKHGAPPIVVRYRSGGTWAELDVDDCGPGLESGAAGLAEQTGHLGLLNMAQRAEAIQADLRIGRRPGGGTRVSLVWEADGPDFEAGKTPDAAAAVVTTVASPAAYAGQQ